MVMVVGVLTDLDQRTFDSGDLFVHFLNRTPVHTKTALGKAMQKITVLFVLCFFVLFGCDNYMDSEAVQGEFEKRHPNVQYTVLDVIDNGEVDDIGAVAADISARDEEYGFLFHILSVTTSNAPFGVMQDYQSDYNEKKLMHLLEVYTGDKGTIALVPYKKKDIAYTDEAQIFVEFVTKSDLDTKTTELSDFLRYAFSKDDRLVIKLRSYFDPSVLDPYSDAVFGPYTDGSIRLVNVSTGDIDPALNIEELFDSFYRRTLKNYAIFARTYLLHEPGEEDYPNEIIESFINAHLGDINTFRVQDGAKSYMWKDVLCNGNLLHYRTLYYVLKRMNVSSLQGTMRDYSFVSNTGVRYSFSDAFTDAKYIGPRKDFSDEPSNYYLKDGKVQFFGRPRSRILTFEELNKITGFEFINIREEKEEKRKEEIRRKEQK